MTLVDTSIWIDHLRNGIPRLQALLQAGEVAIHPFVIGEIACGNLKNRSQILALLQSLPSVTVATAQETLLFIENHGLAGKGIGLIDAHLLVACFLSRARLWTGDKRLERIARALGVRAEP